MSKTLSRRLREAFSFPALFLIQWGKVVPPPLDEENYETDSSFQFEMSLDCCLKMEASLSTWNLLLSKYSPSTFSNG